MSINCPKCNSKTKPFNFEADLFFDRCEDCKGMWMDKGELASTSGSTNDFPDPNTITSGSPGTKNCPKCLGDIRLSEVLFMKANNILVDVCKRCEGIWLDSKELSQLQAILRTHRIEQKKKYFSGKS